MASDFLLVVVVVVVVLVRVGPEKLANGSVWIFAPGIFFLLSERLLGLGLQLKQIHYTSFIILGDCQPSAKSGPILAAKYLLNITIFLQF